MKLWFNTEVWLLIIIYWVFDEYMNPWYGIKYRSPAQKRRPTRAVNLQNINYIILNGILISEAIYIEESTKVSKPLK